MDLLVFFVFIGLSTSAIIIGMAIVNYFEKTTDYIDFFNQDRSYKEIEAQSEKYIKELIHRKSGGLFLTAGDLIGKYEIGKIKKLDKEKKISLFIKHVIDLKKEHHLGEKSKLNKEISKINTNIQKLKEKQNYFNKNIKDIDEIDLISIRQKIKFKIEEYQELLNEAISFKAQLKAKYELAIEKLNEINKDYAAIAQIKELESLIGEVDLSKRNYDEIYSEIISEIGLTMRNIDKSINESKIISSSYKDVLLIDA